MYQVHLRGKKILVVGGHEDLQQYFGQKGMSVKCIQTQMHRKALTKKTIWQDRSDREWLLPCMAS